jgi:EAL domain-containing protein (putative c-di-GMP-specific phosphodiesterase class I)
MECSGTLRIGGSKDRQRWSARQFQQENLADVVARALKRNGVAAQFLELEVTETAILSHPERAAKLLQALEALGVHISLDDFGTGYSSLHYLKRVPIDSLKIDQSFIRDITSDPDDAAIAKLVIALGRDPGHGGRGRGGNQGPIAVPSAPPMR